MAPKVAYTLHAYRFHFYARLYPAKILTTARVHSQGCTFVMKVSMMRIEFSEEEKRALDYERYQHPHPHVQRKIEALWLKSQKLPHKDICRLTGISKPTLCP
jgi:hypothetical protein